ncbi:MAG: hypothetical protein ABFD96_10960 [Armatimonadia bacterium]
MRWQRYLAVSLIILAAMGLLASAASAVPARFTFAMKDAAGQGYEVMIFAPDEQVTPIGPDDVYAAYDEGDRKAEGLYQTTLRRKSGGAPVKQNILLFGDTNRGEFNLERDMAFVLHGGKNQPDVLVVEQYGTSNWNEARLFMIKGGQLRPLAALGYVAREPYRLHATGPLTFRSSSYDNVDGIWTITDWKLDVTNTRLKATRHRQVSFGASDLDRRAR